MRFDRKRVAPMALLVAVVLGGCLAPVSTPDGGSSVPSDESAEQSDRTENPRSVTDGASASGGPTERQSQQRTDSATADGGATGTTAAVPDSRSGPGLAEPIATTATLNQSEITYYPDNGTIRYVAAYEHTNHEAVKNGTEPPEREPVYECVSVDEWLAVQAPYAGAKAISKQVTAKLDGDHSLSTGVSTTENESQVTVATRTLLSRDGNVLASPNVTFDRLQTVTPANVTVTITVGEHSLTRTYPVEVQRMVLQQE